MLHVLLLLLDSSRPFAVPAALMLLLLRRLALVRPPRDALGCSGVVSDSAAKRTVLQRIRGCERELESERTKTSERAERKAERTLVAPAKLCSLHRIGKSHCTGGGCAFGSHVL